jgi:hypothetical protein
MTPAVKFGRHCQTPDDVVDFHLKQSQSESRSLNQIDRLAKLALPDGRRSKVKSREVQPPYLTILAGRDTTSHGT